MFILNKKLLFIKFAAIHVNENTLSQRSPNCNIKNKFKNNDCF